jgi:hypothetical protein
MFCTNFISASEGNAKAPDNGCDPGTTGGDRYTKVNNEMPAGAAAVPNPVPLPAFQGEDPVTGGPISLEDLKGDFAVMTFVDADDPKVAKDVLARLLQVIETIGEPPPGIPYAALSDDSHLLRRNVSSASHFARNDLIC